MSTNEREALLRLAQRAEEVAAWASPGDPWERSRLESALEQLAEEIREEQLLDAVATGIRKAQARSAARLEELGIDSSELGLWVAERVAQGAWPDGDLISAFRAWRAERVELIHARRQARGTMALVEGYEPSEWSMDLDAQIDRGEISLDEAIAKTRARYGLDPSKPAD